MLAPYNRGDWTETAEYRRILNGDMDGYTVSMNDCVLGSMALEAYRCWIEDDRMAGAELCKAIENIADCLRMRRTRCDMAVISFFDDHPKKSSANLNSR